LWPLAGMRTVTRNVRFLAPGEGLDQADVDVVMDPAAAAAPSAPVQYYPAFLDGDDLIPAEMPPPGLRVVSSEPREEWPSRADRSREETRADTRAPQPSDPLAPIVALSAEEKIALFS